MGCYPNKRRPGIFHAPGNGFGHWQTGARRSGRSTVRIANELTLPNFPRKLRAWRKKAAAQNGRADLPVSQDAQQRVRYWHAGHYVKVMLDQIFGENNTN
jgi:hypothetical protein